MAIYLRYDRTAEDDEQVVYRVLGSADEHLGDVMIPKVDPSATPLPDGAPVGLLTRVVGRAWSTAQQDGQWPAGGLIQS